MKRILCLFLASVLLLCSLGCSKEQVPITLSFFYPRQNYGYDASEGRFYDQSAQEELREDIIYHSARQVIGIYLEGPLDPALINPFPDETALLMLNLEGNTLNLTLTDQFAQLTGIQLIMACSCLAKTAMTITKATQVCIRCETALLDGMKTVTIGEETVFFDDPITQIDAQ